MVNKKQAVPLNSEAHIEWSADFFLKSRRETKICLKNWVILEIEGKITNYHSVLLRIERKDFQFPLSGVQKKLRVQEIEIPKYIYIYFALQVKQNIIMHPNPAPVVTFWQATYFLQPLSLSYPDQQFLIQSCVIDLLLAQLHCVCRLYSLALGVQAC